MNAVRNRTLLRAGVFAAFCGVVVCVWKIETKVDLHGIPPGLIGLLILVPSFLVWFFGTELRRERISGRTFKIPVVFALILILAAGFDMAATRIRYASPRMSSMNNLKQLSLAMLNYQEKHGTLPPAIVRSPDGKPLYSWRVLLLPYLEQQRLFNDFHLDEPWDSDHNKALIGRMPRMFADPSERTVNPGQTFYQMLVGPGAMPTDGTGLKSPLDFPDGIATTMLIAEGRNPVIWTQPVDLPFLADGQIPDFGPLHGSSPPQYFCAAMVDGSVKSIKLPFAPQDLRPWITRNGKDTPGEID